MRVKATEKFEDLVKDKRRRVGDEFDVDDDVGHRMIRQGLVMKLTPESRKSFQYENKRRLPVLDDKAPVQETPRAVTVEPEALEAVAETGQEGSAADE